MNWQFVDSCASREIARLLVKKIMRENPHIIARYRADLIESFGGPVGQWVVELQPL